MPAALSESRCLGMRGAGAEGSKGWAEKMRPSINQPIALRIVGRSDAFIVLFISIVLIVPCFWQSRIQAGDLSSHLYNAWLSRLISDGLAPGLTIARQYTNVLFDLALVWIWSMAGAHAAERISVSVAVLVFFWGAFTFVCVLSRRRPWFLVPCLAMLAYGWVSMPAFSISTCRQGSVCGRWRSVGGGARSA